MYIMIAVVGMMCPNIEVMMIKFQYITFEWLDLPYIITVLFRNDFQMCHAWSVIIVTLLSLFPTSIIECFYEEFGIGLFLFYHLANIYIETYFSI